MAIFLKGKTIILSTIIFVLAISIVSEDVQALGTFSFATYKAYSGNSTAYLRAPDNSAPIGNRTTFYMTIVNENVSNLRISGWSINTYILPHTIIDIPVKVTLNNTKITLYSDDMEFFRLAYVVTPTRTKPKDDNWDEESNETSLNPQVDLWSPFNWALMVGSIIFIGVSFAYLFTRISLLINWSNSVNMVIVGVAVFLSFLNMFYRAWFGGSTDLELLISWAYFALRQLILMFAVAAWFLGVGFARYAIGLSVFWKFDIFSRVIKPLDGIIYSGPDGEDKIAWQTVRKAWARLRGRHNKVIFKNDKNLAKHDWDFDDGFGKVNVHIINDFKILESGDVVIDCTGKSCQTYRIRDNTGKIKVVNVTSDFTNIGHLLGCNLEIKEIPEWIDHCDSMQQMRTEYDRVCEEKKRVQVEFMVSKNQDAMKWSDLANDGAMELAFGNELAGSQKQLDEKKKELTEEAMAIKAKREKEQKEAEKEE